MWAALRSRLPQTASGRTVALPNVAGVLALAPILNLAQAHRDGSGAGAVQEFLRAGPDEAPQRYGVADPSRLGPADVPVTLVHGGEDEFVPVCMSRAYAVRTSATLIALPAVDHFDVIDTASPAWPVALRTLRGLTQSVDQPA